MKCLVIEDFYQDFWVCVTQSGQIPIKCFEQLRLEQKHLAQHQCPFQKMDVNKIMRDREEYKEINCKCKC